MYAAKVRNRFVQDGLSTVPPARLLLMLYERLLRDLDDAGLAIGEGSIPASHEALVHAQAILDELRLALDPTAWDGADNLGALYDWATVRLMEANLRKDARLVASCREVLAPLAEAWNAAYDQQAGEAPVGARSA